MQSIEQDRDNSSIQKQQKHLTFTSVSTHHRTKRESDFDHTTPLINNYRQTLSSYDKMFPPRSIIPLIDIEPVATQRGIVISIDENAREEINVEQIRPHYTHKKEKSREQEKQIKTPWKSLTETKAKKRMTLEGNILKYTQPTNLQFQLHKQRFFHTFLKKSDLTKSSDKLKSIRKKLILE